MKLRNKKTGKVFDVIVREKSNGDGEYSIIVCDLRALRRARSVSSILGEYDSLDKLCEEWEDYKPADPYIEDEKIRKFVRDWATFNKIVKACIQKPDGKDYWYKVLGNDKEAKCAWAIYIRASYSETVSKDYNCDGPMIPIAELCGEEEECES